MKPVIKWVGGKTQLLKELKEIIIPALKEDSYYYEPFCGGAALALDLEHKNTILRKRKNIIKKRLILTQNTKKLIITLNLF